MDSQENNHNPEDTERKGLTNPKTNMEWALLYADNGWHVFPIHWIENGQCSCGRPRCSSPGKHPLTANGFKDATIDPQNIRNWWGKFPKANIAVATEVSGLFVVDVDQGPGKVGDKSLQALMARYPNKWPCTAMARSGGSGLHLFFSADYDAAGTDTLLSRSDALGRHIDTRGRAGYLILPPSSHKSGGEYGWVNRVKPVPVPDWLLRLTRAGVSNDDIGMADGERPFPYQWETDPDTGKIVDGRKQYLASLIWNARFTPDDEVSVETAVDRIISEFQAKADLSRPMGNVADRTQIMKDLHRAMRKALSSERDGLYPQIREMDGRLALVTLVRDTEKMVPITTFLIRPIRAIQVPERGEFLDVKLVGGSVEANVRLAPDVWLGARSFRQALNRSAMAFTGSDADVQRIKHYLSTLPMERIAGVAVAGMHDGKFVVSGGALGPNGPVQDLVLAGE
ncbi:bifunctional DNA primase/polymerase [Azospirillum sp. Marseille-Q6669]